MSRDTSPGACQSGVVPVSGSAHRLSEGSLRRLFWIGAFCLVAAPLAAQTVSTNTSPSLISEPCSSARAVHDMRCPNYTGFKSRLGGRTSEFELPAGPVLGGGLSPGHGELRLKPGGTTQRGLASWYGPGFHGRLTANGERYDMNELTAAHKTLPFGTQVLVRNPRTGKEVVVRINDRGPYVAGRVIDLSKAAAEAVGIDGVGAVELHEMEEIRVKVKAGGAPLAGGLAPGNQGI